MEILEEVRGEQHTDTWLARWALARAVMAGGQPDEADSMLREVLDGLTALPLVAHQSDPHISRAELILRQCLTRTGSFAEAECPLLNAYKKLARVWPAGHVTVRAAIRSRIELYDARGRPDEAAIWKAEFDLLSSLRGAAASRHLRQAALATD